MSVELRSNKNSIFLVGEINHQITGAKLPSNRQIFGVLFFNIREIKLNISESANLVARECIIFWEKARIPTRAFPNCVKKIVDLYQFWRELQKNCKKIPDFYKRREEEFQQDLDNLFDIAHADALNRIKIEEDKVFLRKQREPGRPGCLMGVDKKLAVIEEKARLRQLAKEKYRLKQMPSDAVSTSVAAYKDMTHTELHDKSASSEESLNEPTPSTSQSIRSLSAVAKRGRKNFITPKLVATLDRCQLSIRDSVYVVQAVVEALGLNCDDYPINKSSIQRIRTQMRKHRAESIKSDFQNNIPEVVAVHWDGKLLPSLNVKSSKEERLPIVISFEEKEQILAVPKLESSSGKNQANAVLNTLNDWNLNDKVQIMCCDTTASNTGRLNGACVLLEQALERELLLFACRHHVYELVLKSVFQTKIQEDSTSPEIPLFKKFKDNWKNINPNAIEPCSNFVKQHFCETMINELVEFYYNELEKSIVRDDHRELIELAIIFLGGNSENKIKIRPPGALHQARWMARAIYSIKICLLQSQFKMSVKDEQGLRDISLFIVTVYVKPWLRCSLAVKAPNQDLLFLKTLKDYERVDKLISKAALGKFSHHLWYLSEEITLLSIFDEDVDEQTKKNIVINLKRESFDDSGKRYVPSKDETSISLYGEYLFICIKLCSLFTKR
ncbi:uncharacterized protein [Eurosta solidaginis]|uniref:uncharacterized protein n=1 Tax=Eurosta solidaginis TaxID=178769 RepID=UPI0035315814